MTWYYHFWDGSASEGHHSTTTTPSSKPSNPKSMLWFVVFERKLPDLTTTIAPPTFTTTIPPLRVPMHNRFRLVAVDFEFPISLSCHRQYLILVCVLWFLLIFEFSIDLLYLIQLKAVSLHVNFISVDCSSDYMLIWFLCVSSYLCPPPVWRNF